MTTLHDVGGVLGRPWDTFLLGSHTLMVTALGSCVKWPLSMVLSGRDGGNEEVSDELTIRTDSTEDTSSPRVACDAMIAA